MQKKKILTANALFYVLQDTDTSANDLNHNLEKISELGFQWKIMSNEEFTKQP